MPIMKMIIYVPSQCNTVSDSINRKNRNGVVILKDLRRKIQKNTSTKVLYTGQRNELDISPELI